MVEGSGTVARELLPVPMAAVVIVPSPMDKDIYFDTVASSGCRAHLAYDAR